MSAHDRNVKQLCLATLLGMGMKPAECGHSGNKGGMAIAKGLGKEQPEAWQNSVLPDGQAASTRWSPGAE